MNSSLDWCGCLTHHDALLIPPPPFSSYVALTTLLRTVQGGDNASDAVQRHRETIVDCLREPDITIRRRALALVFALINANNVALLVAEVLAFLKVADAEFKAYIVTELLIAANKFSPSHRWHVDTCLEILRVASAYVQEEGVAEIVQILASKAELHRHVSQELYAAFQKVWFWGWLIPRMRVGGKLNLIRLLFSSSFRFAAQGR